MEEEVGDKQTKKFPPLRRELEEAAELQPKIVKVLRAHCKPMSNSLNLRTFQMLF